MKLHLTHNDIREMVYETVNRLNDRGMLMEISTADAFTRFYQGKIPPKYYNALMAGADQMTPLHKMAADYLVQAYVGKKYAKMKSLVELVSNFWNTANNESKQYVIRVCKEEANSIKSDPDELRKIVTQLASMKSHSEGSYTERGFEVLYEDDKVIVTCTKSYSSSCHHYGRSHWCTASDQFGEYDGFEMFKRYTVQSRAILVQFVVKGHQSKTCQAQIMLYNSNYGQICNWEDDGMSSSELCKLLIKYGIDFHSINQNYIRPNVERLCRETKEIVDDEEVYYVRKKAERRKTMIRSIANAVNSQNCTDFAVNVFSRKEIRCRRENGYAGWYELWEGVPIVYVRYDGRTTAEQNFLEEYYDDEFDMAEELGGPLLCRMIFVFDNNGNITAKIPGEITIKNHKFAIITDIYDDYLETCKVTGVIMANTGEVILRNVKPIETGSCDDYIGDVQDKMPENVYKVNFEGNNRYGEWFVFGNNKNNAYALSSKTGKLVEIPYDESWFTGNYNYR